MGSASSWAAPDNKYAGSILHTTEFQATKNLNIGSSADVRFESNVYSLPVYRSK